MRKLLMLSLLALLTASATGCISSNPCGGWHPGALAEELAVIPTNAAASR